MTYPADTALARTKADPNRSMREDALVAEVERLRAALVEIAEGGAPAAFEAIARKALMP